MGSEFENFLSDISQAFFDGDFALWRARLILPFSLITKHEPLVLKTDEAVASNFALYLQAMEVMCLDVIDRSPASLEECPDGTCLGTFQTRLLCREQLATAPYTSTALLHVVEGRFRMSSMLNARGHFDWTGVTDT